MATPLREARREAIARLVVAHRFDPINERLNREQERLADAVYRQAYTEQEREFMASAPKGALPESSNVSVKYDKSPSDIVSLNFTAVPFGSTVKIEYRRIYADRQYKVLTVSDELQRKVWQYIRDKAAYTTDRNQANGEILKILKSFRTVEKLLESWPEIAEFVTATAPKDCIQLPAINYSDLNARFGLPPETAVS